MKKRGCVCLIALILLLLQIPAREAAVPADGDAALPGEVKYAALTFDDGPHPEHTERLLDGLLQRGTSATFFLVGERLAGSEELVRRMQREGHQIGNHTWSHQSLQGIGEPAFRAEIQRVDAALEAILGKDHYWVRPPYGHISQEQMDWVEVPLVKWSVDPRDWESRDDGKVVQAVLEQIRPGSIILLHDIHPTSVDAALQLVDRLEEEGYVFVTVEELLALYGIQPRAGVMYRAGTGQITSEGTK